MENVRPQSEAHQVPASTTGPRLLGPKWPMYDLDSSIDVAAKLHERGRGGVASSSELATFLGYSGTRNGAFVSRLSAAKMFGLVEGPNAALRPTPRALDILQPDYEATEARARLDAFRAVPLFAAFLREYADKTLPQTAGMLNALETKFGVAANLAGTALDRLLDSADEAGLFAAAGNRTKMIIPTLNEAPNSRDETPPKLESVANTRSVSRPAGGGAGSGTGAPHRYPILIEGILEYLPSPDGRWDEDQMRDWLELLEHALRVVYKLPRARDS